MEHYQKTSLPFGLLVSEKSQASETGQDMTKTYTNASTIQDGTDEKDTDWEEGT